MQAAALRIATLLVLACFSSLCSSGSVQADDLTPQQSGVSTQTLFTFRHVIIDNSTNAPRACLRFSQNLDPSPAAHYGDYLRFSPALQPALTATGTDLCIGGMDAATTYKLTIRQGLPAVSGARLASDQKLDLALQDRAPLVAIAGDGFILSRQTTNGLAIQTVNVAKIKIHVLRMSDKLLPIEIDPSLGSGNIALNTQTMNGYQLNSLLQNVVGIAWTGTMDVATDHNRTVTTAFPIASVVPPGRNGLYLVIAENAAKAAPETFFTSGGNASDDTDSNQDYAAHWVVATDIALTTMTGSDGLHVFARSLATARPIPNVDVRLISTGQDTLGKLLTDAGGAAFFPAPLLAGSRANAAAALLAYGPGGNFAFQDLTRPAFDLSDRGVSGRAPPKSLQAFMYTERGIYRPGETVDLIALLRDRLGNAVANLPLKLLLRRPDGVVDRAIVAPPAPDGGVFVPVKLSATAARGTWALEAYVDPTAPPVGRAEVDVQDFVPQQLKVALTATEKTLATGDPFRATLAGAFLYGAPAAGLHAQGDIRVTRDFAPVAGANGYSFGLVDDQVTDADNTLSLDDADAKGNLGIAGALPAVPKTTVPLKAVLTAGLFEPSGRYVSDTVTVPLRAQKLLIGVKPLFSGGQLGAGEAAHFAIQAYDDSGKPVAHPGLSWTLVEENQIFDWFEDGSSNWTFHYHTEDQLLASGSLDVAAAKPLDFAPPSLGQYDWGTYRLIIADNATGAATSVRFNVGWDSTGGSANTPDKAEVSVEQPLLKPGATTKVHIKGPFAGPAQIVIANDRVFSTQSVDVPAAGATISVTADPTWGAGAYVLVTMARPLNPATAASGGPQPPVRAIGVAWLGIDPASHALAVAIAAPPKVTPRQTVTIPVHVIGAVAGDRPYVTLAAVDEGILQLTRYATPDPLAFLYGKLALGLDIRDDYGNLLDGSADAGAIHMGGDAGSLGGPGLAVESTEVVSLFSGPVEVSADGIANIPVTIPDFEGQLRLMAIAYNGSQVGQSQATLIVRDPVIEDVALPRFLAPGDTAQLAVSLHNTDGAAGAYHLALAATGPASIGASHRLDYTLAVGQRVQDAATIKATAVGVAEITGDLTGPDGYRVHRGWQIAVRAPHYPITLQQIALAPKGGDFRPDPKLLANFMPGTMVASIGYAGFEGIDVPSLLQSLYTYPFGCTEQLASTAFPLLYYNQKSLLGGVLPGQDQDSGDTPAAVKDRVQQAIDTILDRQDSTGTFGLWDVGDGEASAWLNVYTMDFLLRAKTAGFAVPDDALNRGFANLRQTVAKIDSGAAGTSYTEAGLEAPQATLAYAEYVLAESGQADISLLRRKHDAAVYANDTDGATRYAFWIPGGNGAAPDGNDLAQPLALAQLGGALTLMGDQSRAASAMQMAVANIGVRDYPVWWFDEAYYTEQRDLAGIIAIAADEGDTTLVNTLLIRLNRLNLNTDDLNTQDKAWLLAAAAALNRNSQNIGLTLNGKPLTGLSLPAAFAPTPAQIAAGYVITNSSGRDLWRSFTVSGAPVRALPAFARGYTLKKTYFSLDGKPLNPSRLRQNDRFIVSLTGDVADDDDHRTVLVDLLPAAWEIDAPITDDSTSYSFLGPLSATRVIEARDDRFVAAFDLGDGWTDGSDNSGDSGDNSQGDSKPSLDSDQFHLAYLVRVVTPGHFTLPEAEVNDMYRPALMARTSSGATIADPR